MSRRAVPQSNAAALRREGTAARRRAKAAFYPAQELRRRAQGWAVKLRVDPRSIRIQGMRHKWGSCSSAGTVTLASELIDEPPGFQDYVIVHELLHLRLARHGRLFKALLGAHVPHWRRWTSSQAGMTKGRVDDAVRTRAAP
jgi:predicted metal-dependent hydrolase